VHKSAPSSAAGSNAGGQFVLATDIPSSAGRTGIVKVVQTVHPLPKADRAVKRRNTANQKYCQIRLTIILCRRIKRKQQIKKRKESSKIKSGSVNKSRYFRAINIWEIVFGNKEQIQISRNKKQNAALVAARNLKSPLTEDWMKCGKC
jgi:hypothetical protein